jgi:hypothetical protein
LAPDAAPPAGADLVSLPHAAAVVANNASAATPMARLECKVFNVVPPGS